jgi:anti-sigma28 factor (negative regulator of flagellin synthesis)
MSTINNVGASDPTSPLSRIVGNPVQKNTAAADGASPPRAADSVDLSGVQHFIEALKTNNIRADKVAAVRQQIDAGTYEDDYKLDVASSKLLDELTK